jgi:hypothetical protein
MVAKMKTFLLWYDTLPFQFVVQDFTHSDLLTEKGARNRESERPSRKITCAVITATLLPETDAQHQNVVITLRVMTTLDYGQCPRPPLTE